METLAILLIMGTLLFIILFIMLIAFLLKPKTISRRPVREDLQKIKSQIEDKAYI